MLNVMRDNLKHLKPVLWIVAISMTLYLGTFFFDGSGGADGEWVARVDGSPVANDEFLEALQRAEGYYRELLGEQYEQLKPQLRLPDQVLQSIINSRIMVAEARNLGLEAGAAEISEQIRTNPAFRDAGGFIGRERYVQLVRRQLPRDGVEGFERALGEEITRQKWMDLVGEPARVSDREVTATYWARNVRAAIDYVLVPSAKQKTDTEISDAEARAWYESHPKVYERGEGRAIRYVVVERQSQLPKVQIDEAQIQAYYDANPSDLGRPEQRRTRRILLRVLPEAGEPERRSAREQADAVLQRLLDGEDFETLARTLSQDPVTAPKGGDMGFISRGVRPGGDVIFSTPVGEVTPVIETPFGFEVIQVTDSRPAGVLPLDEVRDSIRSLLVQRGAQELAVSEAARIQAEVSSPEALDAVASREGLEVRERVVTRDDRMVDLGPSPEFLDTVFRMDPGTASPPLSVGGGMAVVVLQRVDPPGLAPLDEIEERVRTDLLNDRARRAAVESAERALARGKNLQAVAKTLGAEVTSSDNLSPGVVTLPGAGGPLAELDEKLFRSEAKEGDSGVAPVQSGAIVYTITKLQGFDQADFEAQKEGLRIELLGARRNALVGSVLEKLRGQHEVEINREMMAQLGS